MSRFDAKLWFRANLGIYTCHSRPVTSNINRCYSYFDQSITYKFALHHRYYHWKKCNRIKQCVPGVLTLEGLIRRRVGIRGGLNGWMLRIENRLCDSGFDFLTLAFLTWTPTFLLPELSMEDSLMNRILNRLVLLWFAAGDIIEGTS